jgi:hypothetical protein
MIAKSLTFLFHHIRTVPTITDAIAMPCENHFQIVGAKRVPASKRRRKRVCKTPFLFENQKKKSPMR